MIFQLLGSGILPSIAVNPETLFERKSGAPLVYAGDDFEVRQSLVACTCIDLGSKKKFYSIQGYRKVRRSEKSFPRSPPVAMVVARPLSIAVTVPPPVIMLSLLHSVTTLLIVAASFMTSFPPSWTPTAAAMP